MAGLAGAVVAGIATCVAISAASGRGPGGGSEDTQREQIRALSVVGASAVCTGGFVHVGGRLATAVHDVGGRLATAAEVAATAAQDTALTLKSFTGSVRAGHPEDYNPGWGLGIGQMGNFASSIRIGQPPSKSGGGDSIGQPPSTSGGGDSHPVG